MVLRQLLAATAAATVLASPAMAEGLESSYLGTGMAIGLNGQGGAASLVGRAALPAGALMLSFRPQLNIYNSVEGAVGATLDVPVASETNFYVGGGGAFRNASSTGVLTGVDSSVGYVQLGAETGLAPRIALYLDGKITLGSQTQFVPTLGLGYRF